MGLKTLDQMIDNLGGHLVGIIFVLVWSGLNSDPATIYFGHWQQNEKVAKHLLSTACQLLHSRHGLKASSINNQKSTL